MGKLLAVYFSMISVYVSFLGAFIGLWILATSSLFERDSGRKSWPRKAQLAALFMAFPVGFGNSMLPIYATSVIIRGVCFDPKLRAAAIDVEFTPFIILQNWASQISLIINDAVVTWRVWALYPG